MSRRLSSLPFFRGAVSLFTVVVSLVSPILAQDATTPKPQTTAPVFDSRSYLLPLNEEATMTGQASGDQTITWTIDSDSVDIYLFDNPDHLPKVSGKPSNIVTGAKQFEVKGQANTARTYAILRFKGGAKDGQTIIVAERRLPLSGVGNLRDIGGYKTENGKQVRWGRVYRAEALATLTDNDLTYLDKLGLKLVCDFRGISEAAAAPDKLPKSGGLVTAALPIGAGTAGKSTLSLVATTLKGDTDALNTAMANLYSDMIDTHAKDAFGALIADIADNKNLPTLYHCTAGKDRTGVATALILRAVGVPEKTVLADYSLTNLAFDSLMKQARNNKQLAAAGISPERLGPLMAANPVWLEKTLRHIDEKYGSVEGYLTGPCGLDKSTLDKLRANLLY